MRAIFLLCVLVAFAAPASAQPCVDNASEVRPVLADETRTQYERNLADPHAALARNPKDADAMIWYGRRTAYLGRYKDAIRIFSEGIAAFPQDARFYRHRGHRYITLRCFDDAIADLERAVNLIAGKKDEVEPDGIPNAKNVPTSTLHTNIYYHLGIAHYMKADWSRAAGAFMNSFNRSMNSDMKVASALWVYASAARFGTKLRKDADGLLTKEIPDGLEVIENGDYYSLIKLNKGKLNVEVLLKDLDGGTKSLSSATLGYGIGNYFLYNGDRRKAIDIFRKIVDGDQWSSFGYIAAEAELKRP